MKRELEEIADELLVLRAQDGDGPAMQFLVRRWQGRLLKHAWDVTGQRDVAADVVQEAWMAIIRGIHRLNDPAAFRGWAYRIVHRRAVDWVRKQKRQRDVIDRIGRENRFGGPAEALSARDDIDCLRAAISQLDADEKLLLRMYYSDEMRVKEIAAALSLPAGTVKYRLFCLRERLKSLIERNQS